MTLLLLLKPIFHQGHSPPAETTAKKRRKRVARKQYAAQLAQELAIPEIDVSAYIDDVLKREAEVLRLRAEAAERADEQARMEAEAEEKNRIAELLEQISEMMKRALVEKRKRLNRLIASILDWL